MAENENTEIENTIIVGSGPAGYTAALYTARANLRPLVIEGFAWGGLLQQTTDVENYPGFPEGIMGPELMAKMRAQAERFGARLETDQAERVQLASEPGGVHSVWVGDTEHRARTVILAMGAEHKRLGVPGEEELGGRGVSYCATCDAAFFKGAPTMIVGGGDSAMEEAIFLSKFATKVVVVHRREEWRASKIMLERARERENIEFLTPYTVKSFLPGENGALDRAVLSTPAAARSASWRSAARSSRSGTSPSPSSCAGRWRWTRTGTWSPRAAPLAPTAPGCSPRATWSTTPTARPSPPRVRLPGGAGRGVVPARHPRGAGAFEGMPDSETSPKPSGRPPQLSRRATE